MTHGTTASVSMFCTTVKPAEAPPAGNGGFGHARTIPIDSAQQRRLPPATDEPAPTITSTSALPENLASRASATAARTAVTPTATRLERCCATRRPRARTPASPPATRADSPRGSAGRRGGSLVAVRDDDAIRRRGVARRTPLGSGRTPPCLGSALTSPPLQSPAGLKVVRAHGSRYFCQSPRNTTGCRRAQPWEWSARFIRSRGRLVAVTQAPATVRIGAPRALQHAVSARLNGRTSPRKPRTTARRTAATGRLCSRATTASADSRSSTKRLTCRPLRRRRANRPILHASDPPRRSIARMRFRLTLALTACRMMKMDSLPRCDAR